MCVGKNAKPPPPGTFGDLSEFGEATGFFSELDNGMGQERALRAFFPLEEKPVDYEVRSYEERSDEL